MSMAAGAVNWSTMSARSSSYFKTANHECFLSRITKVNHDIQVDAYQVPLALQDGMNQDSQGLNCLFHNVLHYSLLIQPGQRKLNDECQGYKDTITTKRTKVEVRKLVSCRFY